MPSAMGAVGNPVLVELTRQTLERMQTQITAQTAALSGHNADQLKLLGDIATSLSRLADDGGGGSGGGGDGGYGSGPNASRPRMPGNQTRRPRMGPTGYPGPGGPGYGPDPFGGFGHGRMGGMGGLLGMAQSGAAQMIHKHRGLGDGDWREVSDPDDPTKRAYARLDSQGNVTDHVLSEEEYARRGAISQRAYAAGSARGPVGAIKGLVGDLSPGMKFAGGAATAAIMVAEGGYKLGHFIGNQRAANAQYQAIYGPGSSGFDQRVHNAGYRFRNTMRNLGSAFGGDGGLSDSDADKAFKGISAMGYQGADRNNMLGFARGNFNTSGMSVDQSLALIGINAKEAGSSLQELHTRLKQVSEQALQTGQSAEVFRQSFIQNYGQAVSAGFAGSSGTLAQAQVASTVGQGRLFAGLNTSAMYGSVGAQQVLANRMGMSSVLDFTIASENNPMVAAQAQQKQLNQVFEAVVPAQVRSAVQAAIGRHGGAQNVATNQNAAMEVVRDVEQQAPGSLNSIAIQQAMLTAGIAGAQNLDTMACAIYYVQWVAKSGRNFTDPVAKAIAGKQQQSGAQASNSAARAVLAHRPEGVSRDSKGKVSFDPVIDAMAASHVKMVQVQTKDGTQLVTLQTAASQYRDQLANGTAIIGSGPDAGKSVKSVYGSEQNNHYADTTSTKAVKPLLGMGTSKQLSTKELQHYHDMGLTDEQIGEIAQLPSSGLTGNLREGVAKRFAQQGGAGGKVTVGLSAEAKKFLTISTSGDNLVNEAAASGGVPTIPGATGSPTGR